MSARLLLLVIDPESNLVLAVQALSVVVQRQRVQLAQPVLRGLDVDRADHFVVVGVERLAAHLKCQTQEQCQSRTGTHDLRCSRQFPELGQGQI